MTRQEYLKNPNQNHRLYYGQFVTQEIKDLVVQKIQMRRIVASNDPHMNDIPLVLWDGIANRHSYLLKNGSGYSLACGVCILKEAARQLKDEESNRISA